MSMQKKTLQQLVGIAAEVIALAKQVVYEIDNQEAMELVDRHWETGQKYDGPAPATATHPGYSKSTAALKRRSMDLTRTLADIRRAN